MGDDFSVIILNDKSLSQLIIRNIKNIFNEVINKIDISLEHINQECTRISNKSMAGFYMVEMIELKKRIGTVLTF